LQIMMDYGRNGLLLDVPDDADIFLVRETPVVADETATIREALRNPFQSAPFGSHIRKGMNVLIVHTDVTRATPNDRLLPVILDEIERNGIRKEDITLMNAVGTHRPQTEQELKHMLGDSIFENYTCFQHDAYDETQLISYGQNSQGHPILLNRALKQADLTILTGFIEPHFFAGYSGGPKAVLPGLAGVESIFANHSPVMISHPKAAFNITEGNHVWEEMKEAALRVENTFLVNVTLNRTGEITGVFAGDVIAAHAEGCRLLQRSSLFSIDTLYDVVVTSNSGYPLDQNLYQCVKGMSAARRAVRDGGAILLLAACEEGLPDHSSYANLLMQADSPDALRQMLSVPDFVCQDSWQVQVQALVMQHADVFVYSENLFDAQIKASLLHPCRNLPNAIKQLTEEYGKRICVLPQGPLTILTCEG